MKVRPIDHSMTDDYDHEMLHHACEMGHLELVRRFLDEGTEPTEVQEDIGAHTFTSRAWQPGPFELAIKPRHPGRERYGDNRVVEKLLRRFPRACCRRVVTQ